MGSSIKKEKLKKKNIQNIKQIISAAEKVLKKFLFFPKDIERKVKNALYKKTNSFLLVIIQTDKVFRR